MVRKTIIMALLIAAGAGIAGAAWAQGDDPVVARAKADGVVGEQADGYLGMAKASGGDVKAAIDAINIKRRQIYTDIAARQGATVQEVAAARGCDQLVKRVPDGQMYKGAGGWEAKSGAPHLPTVCG